MPVRRNLIQSGLVEAAFKVEAENEQYPPFEVSSVSTNVATEGECFRVVIWSGDKERKYWCYHSTLPSGLTYSSGGGCWPSYWDLKRDHIGKIVDRAKQRKLQRPRHSSRPLRHTILPSQSESMLEPDHVKGIVLNTMQTSDRRYPALLDSFFQKAV